MARSRTFRTIGAGLVIVAGSLIIGCMTIETVPLVTDVDWSEYRVEEYTPSPEDWRKEIIYFLVTDRFADGDPTNNDMGVGEYNPEDVEYYHGGDFRGIVERLDYIKATGSTAIWLTPPVANQWLSPTYAGGVRYSGYHGYWAHDYYDTDAHFGTLNEYRVMVREAHERGLYVIQDIVPNHMGDFYSEDGEDINQDGIPPRPAAPFDDVDRRHEFFHFGGTTEQTRGFFSLLDDMHTENEYVIDQLIEIFKFWIRETDIDGYRIDTVKYVPIEFWERFIPEILDYAASLGKDNFLIFGEAYDFDNVIALRLEESDEFTGAYTGTADDPLFPSMLDFSVAGAISKVYTGMSVSGLSREQGSFELIAERFSDRVRNYYAPHARDQRVVFFDNHDMLRFMGEGKADQDEDLLTMAVTTLYTLPGIPQLYYGTEQAFHQPEAIKNGQPGTDNRQDLWDSGYAVNTPVFRHIARMADVRLSYDALTLGSFESIVADEGPLFLYARRHESGDALVAINRGDESLTIDATAYLDGAVFDLYEGGDEPIDDAVAIPVPAEGFRVLGVSP